MLRESARCTCATSIPMADVCLSKLRRPVRPDDTPSFSPSSNPHHAPATACKTATRDSSTGTFTPRTTHRACDQMGKGQPRVVPAG
ncbi:hypothetical protein SGLAU_32740 (plasmid) [Streptomyces glaucescens]|uniref:Uncharacterized protein n=1 Tax=Streptomyces glaucescens TaxID=1907 RepID=A0A089XMN7_STRGA|nr:hypothetical protein SGLAU_32740 [Streptomyces glaucescens]